VRRSGFDQGDPHPEELEMQRMEAEGDRRQTIRDERNKQRARESMETKDFTIKNPDAEASFRQRQAIGFSLLDAAFPGGLTKQMASEWISQLKADETPVRRDAISALIERIQRESLS
jgi:hypothetical protein